MPGVEVHEGHEEVKTDSGCRRNDEIGEGVVSDCLWRVVIFELVDDDVDRCKGRIGHDDSVADHTPEEHLLGTLRTVAHGQDELHADEKRTGVAEDVEDDFANVVTEGIHFRVSQRTSDEEKGEIKVGEREECEQQLHKLVDELDVEEDLAPDGVVSRPDLLEVEERVDGCEEGTVEPTSTLGDELRHRVCRTLVQE